LFVFFGVSLTSWYCPLARANPTWCTEAFSVVRHFNTNPTPDLQTLRAATQKLIHSNELKFKDQLVLETWYHVAKAQGWPLDSITILAKVFDDTFKFLSRSFRIPQSYLVSFVKHSDNAFAVSRLVTMVLPAELKAFPEGKLVQGAEMIPIWVHELGHLVFFVNMYHDLFPEKLHEFRDARGWFLYAANRFQHGFPQYLQLRQKRQQLRELELMIILDQDKKIKMARQHLQLLRSQLRDVRKDIRTATTEINSLRAKIRILNRRFSVEAPKLKRLIGELEMIDRRLIFQDYLPKASYKDIIDRRLVVAAEIESLRDSNDVATRGLQAEMDQANLRLQTLSSAMVEDELLEKDLEGKERLASERYKALLAEGKFAPTNDLNSHKQQLAQDIEVLQNRIGQEAIHRLNILASPMRLGREDRKKLVEMMAVMRPFDELFSDLLAVIISGDPSALVKALLPEDILKPIGWINYRKERVNWALRNAVRDFAYPRTIGLWEEKSPHLMLAPTRHFIYRELLTHPEWSHEPDKTLRLVFDACMDEIKFQIDQGVENYEDVNPSLVNQSLMDRIVAKAFSPQLL
jgi:hypothetical protein